MRIKWVNNLFLENYTYHKKLFKTNGRLQKSYQWNFFFLLKPAAWECPFINNLQTILETHEDHSFEDHFILFF